MLSALLLVLVGNSETVVVPLKVALLLVHLLFESHQVLHLQNGRIKQIKGPLV